MKVYAALLIDGAEDGPRVPCEISFEQREGSEGLKVDLHDVITLGPASYDGIASMRFFTDESTTDDYVLDVELRHTVPAGGSIYYVPNVPLSAL